MRGMRLAALYLVTAIMTAVHVLYLLLGGLYGAPTTATQYVSLVGSVILFVAGAIAFFSSRVAAIIALIGSLAMWCFYVPALVHSFFGFWDNLRLAFSLRQYVPAVGAIACPLLLAICTIYTWHFLRSPRVS
jgi:hypothetical protein